MKPRKILNGRVKIVLKKCPVCGNHKPHEIEECIPPEMNGRYWDSVENSDITPYGIRDEYGGL